MTVPPEPEVRPWGLWATAGFAVVVAAVFVGIELLVEFAFIHWRRATQDDFGLLLTIATLIAAPAGVGLTLLFAALRKGSRVSDYLGLTVPQTRGLWRWLLYLFLFIALFHAVEYASGHPFVTEFQLHAFESTTDLPLLLVAVVVAAPVFEEVFFRGFILSGIRWSRLGTTGAVVITSLLWSIMHIQYSPLEILLIFVGGMLLALARLRTASLYVPVGLHALWNLSASIETMIYLAQQRT
jgi:membrane protease YdiL (CAAX protease family)